MNYELKKFAKNLPDQPGIYQFKDKNGAILYIGKAKSLRKRVNQYFSPERIEPAKEEMIKQASSVETILVKNETEALVLEGTLIHRHQPPFNIRLVDDSSYLYIRISRETYPKVSLERKVQPDGAWYRGPYPNAQAIRQTLKEARKYFPWCGYSNLNKPTLAPPYEGRERRACFAYHIGLCPGICINAISIEEYQANFERLKNFLDGDTTEVLKSLKQRMSFLSEKQDYERAAQVRDKIKAVEKIMIPQDVVTPHDEDADIFGLAQRGGHGNIVLLQLRHGRIISRQSFPLLLPAKKGELDIWEEFMAQYLPNSEGGASVIYLPSSATKITAPLFSNKSEKKLFTPVRGWKKQLVEMAEINAKEVLFRTETELLSPQNLQNGLEELKNAIQLSVIPKRIETYDISNIQGTLATASMIVFIDGKPTPPQYRKFKIINDGAPNDVAMMKETLRRRLKKLTKKNKDQEKKSITYQSWPAPDLIILDGGKPQLNAGVRVLNELNLDIPIISLAKQEEEIFVPEKDQPVILPRTSNGFYLIQRMRDEAHRFTISYHRLLRKKKMTKSVLEEIPGIGPSTRKKLIRAFGSLRGIKSASLGEIKNVLLSEKKAEVVKNFLER